MVSLEIPTIFSIVSNEKELRYFLSKITPSENENEKKKKTILDLFKHKNMKGLLTPSGSIVKGTAVKGHSDIDIIFVMKAEDSKFRTMDLSETRKTFLDNCTMRFIEQFGWMERKKKDEKDEWTGIAEQWVKISDIDQLKPYQDLAWNPKIHSREYVVLFTRKSKYVLSLEVVYFADFSGDPYIIRQKEGKVHIDYKDSFMTLEASEVVQVDVVPAFDLFHSLKIKQTGHPKKIYEFFKADPKPSTVADEFSSSLVRFQLKFMTKKFDAHGETLKHLIVLAKYWIKVEVPKLLHFVKIPSYAVELLCVHVFDKFFVEKNVNLFLGFKMLLELVSNLETLTCHWDTYYREAEIPKIVFLQRPLILDPANPYNNVAAGANWSAIRGLAKVYLQTVCTDRLTRNLFEPSLSASGSLSCSSVKNLVEFSSSEIPKIDEFLFENFENEFVGLSCEVSFPDFDLIADRMEPGGFYYSSNNPSDEERHRAEWVFVADIAVGWVDLRDSLIEGNNQAVLAILGHRRPCELRDRNGFAPIPVRFHLENYDEKEFEKRRAFFRFSHLRTGSCLFFKDIDKHRFMDGSTGFRVEERHLQHILVYPVTLKYMMKVSKLLTYKKVHCWLCERPSLHLEPCRKCGIAKYCNEDCKRLDRAGSEDGSHNRICSRLNEFKTLIICQDWRIPSSRSFVQMLEDSKLKEKRGGKMKEPWGDGGIKDHISSELMKFGASYLGSLAVPPRFPETEYESSGREEDEERLNRSTEGLFI